MESRLLAIRGGLGALFVNGSHRRSFVRREVIAVHTEILADPAVHSGIPDETEVEAAEKAKAAEAQRGYKATVDTDTLVPPKPPVSSSPKLENTLNPPINPTTQQKRHITIITQADFPTLADVACVGLDGSPWPEEEAKRERRRERKEQEEADKEYFKHHKASPLAEIEVADTRKPISRVTDGTADSYGGGGKNVVLFSDEQRDSAEDSLRRATEMWREAAVRGDPDSPHGRILRALRGENW